MFLSTWAYRADTGQQGRLMYPLELQTTPRTEKITSSRPSAVSVLNPRKFPIRRSSLWLLPAPPHTSRAQAWTHNGAIYLPDNKKFKQIHYWQTLSNVSSANSWTKGGEKQDKTICTYKTLNAYVYQYIS